MDKFVQGVLIGLGIVCWAIGVILIFTPKHINLEDTAVLVSDINNGHGSGVYIGNGNIITAAHVVADTDGQITVKQGTTEVSATVVWYDKASDVALLHTDFIKLPAASLACGEPDVVVGDSLEAIGNPAQERDVHTWGRVAKNVFTVHDKGGPFDNVVVFLADLTIAPGSSGGPAFHNGQIAGITNAMVSAPLSMMSEALIPITFVVPRSVICKQLSLAHTGPKFKHS